MRAHGGHAQGPFFRNSKLVATTYDFPPPRGASRGFLVYLKGCSSHDCGAMVQRLARGPFKAEIRVRFPLALPSYCAHQTNPGIRSRRGISPLRNGKKRRPSGRNDKLWAVDCAAGFVRFAALMLPY